MNLETAINTLQGTNQAASRNAERTKLDYFSGYDQALRDIARLMDIELDTDKRLRERTNEKPEGETG